MRYTLRSTVAYFAVGACVSMHLVFVLCGSCLSKSQVTLVTVQAVAHGKNT